MSEESRIVIPRSIIFLVGGFLVIIGLTLVLLGLSHEAKIGGLVLIGPIPFLFYSEEPSSIIAILAFFIFSIVLILSIFVYLVLKRLTPVTE